MKKLLASLNCPMPTLQRLERLVQKFGLRSCHLVLSYHRLLLLNQKINLKLQLVVQLKCLK